MIISCVPVYHLLLSPKYNEPQFSRLCKYLLLNYLKWFAGCEFQITKTGKTIFQEISVNYFFLLWTFAEVASGTKPVFSTIFCPAADLTKAINLATPGWFPLVVPL